MASVLFFSVLILITVNSLILGNLIDYTEKNLDIIPETLKELERINEKQKENLDGFCSYVCNGSSDGSICI